MDFAYLSTGPDQAYTFNGLLDRETTRMSSQSLQGQHPGLSGSNILPYNAFQFANGHHQPPFAYPPPLPDPHDLSAEPGSGPLSDRGNNNLDLTASDVGSAPIVNGRRNASGTRHDSASASTESAERDERDGMDAQSKRRAQNREAQRTFRERKEQKVRDLEAELALYKEKCANLLKTNEELKRQVAKFSTENEILMATAHAHFPRHENKEDEDKAQDTTGPQRTEHNGVNGPVWPNKVISMDDDGDTLMQQGAKVNVETGERFLDASATWDLIVDYRARNNVALDVQDIYERMKGKTKCDGQGAVIGESCVMRAINESLEAGRDDLL